MNYIASTLITEGDSNLEYRDNQLTQDLSWFWDTMSISIFESKQKIIDPFPPGLVFDWEGCRYQVTLPWKSDTIPLSVCYALCVGRSISCTKD